MNKETLISELQKWDGKYTSFLKEIYGINVQNPLFIDDLIVIYSSNIELEHSTTWLIKHYIDNGETLNTKQLNEFFKKMGKLDYWESQLHILQIIPKVKLTRKQIELIEPEIRKLLKSEKKFVKAASYEAYFEIAKIIPELRNEFKLLCFDALERESASVKVKIKRVLNKI